jgi:hypothetical protein
MMGALLEVLSAPQLATLLGAMPQVLSAKLLSNVGSTDGKAVKALFEAKSRAELLGELLAQMLASRWHSCW